MVRVKFRYLVVNFLYPEPSSKSRTALPDLVQIHSPTPDAFNAGALVRLVRDAVEDLYGDYGSGMVSSSLKGTGHRVGDFRQHILTLCSQLLLTLHLDSDNPLSARSLRDGMGGPHIRHKTPESRHPRRVQGAQSQRYNPESGRRGYSKKPRYCQESKSV